jgi:hypothetical protein
MGERERIEEGEERKATVKATVSKPDYPEG